MRKSIYSSVRAVPALNITAVDENGPTNGTAVALDQSGSDYRVASVVAFAGAVTDGTYTFTVQESPNGSTGWTDVPAARLQGAAVIDAANEIAELGVIPNPAETPFLRVVVSAADVTTGGSVGALFLLGSGARTPVAR
jgi:hypothetical protein